MLFFSSKKPAVPSKMGSTTSPHSDPHDRNLGVHAVKYGIKWKVHEKFSPTQRKTIDALLKEGLDSGGSSGLHHEITKGEKEGIIDDVKGIYGTHEADKLRRILEDEV